jgi:xylan 1,4-beta-xylosidase
MRRLGVEKRADGLDVVLYDQRPTSTVRVKMTGTRVWLRADCDFLTERARFSYSFDGAPSPRSATRSTMFFQTDTFQGVRYALFNYNTTGAKAVSPISTASTSISRIPGPDAAHSGYPSVLKVSDMGLGRVALQSADAYLTVADDGGVALKASQPGTAQSFQWMETPTGELVLMSLQTNRFLRVDQQSGKPPGTMKADSPGPQPDGADGVRFIWTPATAAAPGQ